MKNSVKQTKNLRNLSISNLTFQVLNKGKNKVMYGYVDDFAEFEIRRRIKNAGLDYDDLLERESECIASRGDDINNYLIGPNPSMQQLMELYFNYEYMGGDLLFSERHFCNRFDIYTKFFDKICDKEVINIDKRLSSSSLTEFDKEELMLFKELYLKKKERITIFKNDDWVKDVWLSDFSEVYDELFDFEFGNNMTDQDVYKKYCSKFASFRYMIEYFLDNTILELDWVNDFYGVFKVLEDFSKLRSQKEILLDQANSGFEIDYKTDAMRKVLKRVKKIKEEKEMKK